MTPLMAALRYEWTRITTLRSTWWVSGGSLFAGVGVTFIFVLIIRTQAGEIETRLPADESEFFVRSSMGQFSNVDPMFYLLAFVVAVIGILAWGHEYRHGMVRVTLAVVPQRWAVFVAKFLVAGFWVAMLAVISSLMSLLVFWVFFLGIDVQYDPVVVLSETLRLVVYTLLVTWLAMAVTVLVRHQTFSLVLLYLWPMGIEPLVRVLALVGAGIAGDDSVYKATRFMPFNAGGRIIQDWGVSGSDYSSPAVHGVFGDPPSAWAGLLIFGGLTLVLMGAAFASFQKRDA